jgi:type II secretory pathway component PulF
MNRKVRTAFSYPIFLLVAFVIVFNAQVFIILPQFKTMFDNFDRALPAPTQLMLDIGNFYVVYWPHLVVGSVGIVAAFAVWISSTDGRRLWDEVKLKIPVIGRIWRMAALSRLLRTLAVQVQNVVPLVVALELSSSASGNKYIEALILDIVDDIKNGEGIADSFRAHEVFSGIVLQMIASGEETGDFDTLLLSAAEYFDSLLSEQVGTLTGLINPALTVAVGLAIAGMMVAAFLPVFQISRTIA